MFHNGFFNSSCLGTMCKVPYSVMKASSRLYFGVAAWAALRCWVFVAGETWNSMESHKIQGEIKGLDT